jgi:spermidine synthase
VQLGLGAGALTRFTCQQLGMATTVVEINPAVIDVGLQWFHLPPAAEVVRGDAADWLAQAEPPSVAVRAYLPPVPAGERSAASQP